MYLCTSNATVFNYISKKNQKSMGMINYNHSTFMVR